MLTFEAIGIGCAVMEWRAIEGWCAAMRVTCWNALGTLLFRWRFSARFVLIVSLYVSVSLLKTNDTAFFYCVAFFASVTLLRGRIRASIAQFQQELIGHVKEAVSAIQDKFRHRYEV